MSEINYWSDLFAHEIEQKIVEIVARTIYVDKRTRKKILFNYVSAAHREPAEERYCSNPTQYSVFHGYELKLSPLTRYFLLDIDMLEKREQKTGIAQNEPLINYVRTLGLYFETTLNKGLHILFQLNESFSILTNQVILSNNNDISAAQVRLEFKKTCLVWPSANYTALLKPSTISIISTDTCFNILAKICTLLGVDWDNNLNKTILVTRSDSSGSIQQRPTLGDFSKSIRTELEEEEEDGRHSSDDTQSLVSVATKQKLFTTRNVPPPTSRKRSKRNYEEEIIGEFNMITRDVCVSKLNVIDCTELEVENEMPVEVVKKRLLMSQYEQILHHIVVCAPEAAQSLIYHIQPAIMKLAKHMHKQSSEQKTAMFGDDIKLFLEYMLRPDDVYRNLDKKELSRVNIFARLADTKTWLDWTETYCRLILELERVEQKNGRNSRIVRFEDYKLYRKITRLNLVGFLLDEAAALNEYEEIKENVRQKFSNTLRNIVELFLDFILKTLSSVTINVSVVSFFLNYVEYIVDARKELDFYLEILFFVKLKNLDYRITYLVEEGDRGAKYNVAVINFKNYHWVKSNSEFFHNFICKCFPSLRKIDDLLCMLNNHDPTSSDEKINFKQWNNIIPFENGVFDFNNFKEHFANSKRLLSRVNTMFDISLRRSAKTTSVTLDYLAELKNINAFCGLSLTPDELKNFDDVSVFRNYSPSDAVISPIPKSFDITEYLHEFGTTHLLSLDNYSRYSKQFCTYIKCLFGNNAAAGQIGAFQYLRVIITFIILAQGLLRNKSLQVFLNLVGSGSNGKSLFTLLLSQLLGDKMTYVHSSVIFGPPNETLQQAVDLEDNCFIFDIEADQVDLTSFKSFTDEVPTLRRKLYKGIDRDKVNLASVILCSNEVLKYRRKNMDNCKYDLAFERRVFVMPFYNIVGKKLDHSSKLLEMIQKSSLPGLNFMDLVEEEEEEVVSKMDEESLFKKSGFDIKKDRSIIQTGMLYYLLDILHVFNLANLNTSANEVIVSSFANKRMLGKENYLVLSVLLDKYVVLDEIYTNIDEITAREHVDLGEFLLNTPNFKGMHSININDICDKMEKSFGIPVIRKSSTITDSTISSTVGDANQLIGKYFLVGLKEKNTLSQSEENRFRDVNKFYDSNKIDPNMSPEDYVNYNIPIGHRFDFIKDIKTHVYLVVKNLLLNKKVSAKQQPHLSNNYVATTLHDILTSIDDY